MQQHDSKLFTPQREDFLRTKVFGIGLPKTGTTTLGKCLSMLGYRVKGFDIDAAEAVFLSRFDQVMQTMSHYDACRDAPLFYIFRQLDEAFPGSMFILIVRKDAETWLKSDIRQDLRMTEPVSRRASEFFVGHFENIGVGTERPTDLYNSHHESVCKYFAGQESRFRVMNWESGDGWRELCDFIGVDIPENMPFPHENAS